MTTRTKRQRLDRAVAAEGKARARPRAARAAPDPFALLVRDLPDSTLNDLLMLRGDARDGPTLERIRAAAPAVGAALEIGAAAGGAL